MEPDVDLTELDDWLGTLEELQLGLEKNCPDMCNPMRATAVANTRQSHINQIFLNQPTGFTAVLSNFQAEESYPSNTPPKFQQVNESAKATSQNGPRSLPPLSPVRSSKEVTAERNLSNLLKDLEMFEERMRELDQEDNTYKRRYSLASSPSTQKEKHNQIFTDVSAEPSSIRKIKKNNNGTDNGFISVQWVADLHRTTPSSSTDPDILNNPTSSPMEQTPPPPPEFLGAGDACVSPPNTPQPNSLPIELIQQAGDRMWCMREDQGHLNSRSNQKTVVQTTQPPNNQLLNGSFQRLRTPSTFGDYETQEKLYQQMRDMQTHSTLNQVELQPHNMKSNRQLITTSALSDGSTVDCTPSPLSDTPVDGTHIPYQLTAQNHHRLVATEGCNNVGDANQGQHSTDQFFKPNSTSVRCNGGGGSGGNTRMSNSNSPHSTLSDKSLPEPKESNYRYNSDSLKVKKLCVRIFRPDRTTKAIMLSEDMTSGQVASLLIEKNFLTPSTKFVVVEKVPALKVEHVFEEHENVAECILSWPTGSQNMIFFEERPDHFGFIHSPIDWFGDEFAQKYCYNNEETVLRMLHNFDQSGFPEWRDYLYIRKPGAKTWSRRLCVLRSSGLYTSKKNKKTLSPTDLIRILVLDGPLHLYITTGGWTRLRAPTPHGFAFKSYAAQDPTSQHVFCFCATDESALRHWICRLRIAKFGKQLFTNYHNALSRVQMQLVNRHGNLVPHQNLNGSLSAILHRKSSCDLVLPPPASTPSTPLGQAGGANNLLVPTGSPSITKRPALHQQPSNVHRSQLFHSHVPPPNSPLLNTRSIQVNRNSTTTSHGQSNAQHVPFITTSTNGRCISRRMITDHKHENTYMV